MNTHDVRHFCFCSLFLPSSLAVRTAFFPFLSLTRCSFYCLDVCMYAFLCIVSTIQKSFWWKNNTQFTLRIKKGTHDCVMCSMIVLLLFWHNPFFSTEKTMISWNGKIRLCSRYIESKARERREKKRDAILFISSSIKQWFWHVFARHRFQIWLHHISWCFEYIFFSCVYCIASSHYPVYLTAVASFPSKPLINTVHL